MDRNFLLALVLSIAVITAWSYWQAERRKEMQAAAPPTAEEVAPPTPAAAGERSPETGQAGAPTAAPAPKPKAVLPPPAAEEGPAQTVRIESEDFVADLTNRGAALTHWELKQFDEQTPEGTRPIVLTTDEAADALYADTPLEGLGLGDLSRATYRIERRTPDTVDFALERDGVRVRKSWAFEHDTYTFHLSIEVDNGSQRPVAPRFELRWPAGVREGQDYREEALIAYHDGKVTRAPIASVGRPGILARLRGASGTEIQTFTGDIGWAGMDLRYFVAAIAPDLGRNAVVRFEPVTVGETAATVMSFEPVELPPGQKVQREFRAFLGPKKADVLAQFGQDLPLAINRGYKIFAPLVDAFSWALSALYSVIPNYGVAIIILTLLVRVATAPIMAKQTRSMERMREMQPRMKEIQEKHKDDRQAQSEAMMKLYREGGFNPLGGCLPMILQLPVFIGLFYALQSSFALRHAPFFGWIQDLSAPETLFVIPGLDLPVRLLPLLMGGSMVAQQKLQPTTIDPQQARMMMIVMPVMFVFLFYRFPSGLVLYWMLSNLLGIAQQVWVNRGKQKAPAT